MLIFKKEKKVVELALRHAEVTGEGLQIMADAIGAYLDGDTEHLSHANKQVDRLETDADDILREIRELLYSGAYLPTIRGDIYKLLSGVDRVTNKIEDCLDFVNYQKPAVASEYRANLARILEETLVCYAELGLALRAFFKPKGEVEDLRKHCRNVGETESKIDKMQRKLTLRIFEGERDLAEKQHVVELLSRITRISDRIENTADDLELLSLKSII